MRRQLFARPRRLELLDEISRRNDFDASARGPSPPFRHPRATGRESRTSASIPSPRSSGRTAAASGRHPAAGGRSRPFVRPAGRRGCAARWRGRVREVGQSPESGSTTAAWSCASPPVRPARRAAIGLEPWKSYSSHPSSPALRSRSWTAATSSAMVVILAGIRAFGIRDVRSNPESRYPESPIPGPIIGIASPLIALMTQRLAFALTLAALSGGLLIAQQQPAARQQPAPPAAAAAGSASGAAPISRP